MKKMLFAASMLTMVSFPVVAQFSLGVIGGFHKTKGFIRINDSNPMEIGRSEGLSPSIGAIADIDLGKEFSLQPAIVFSDDGFLKGIKNSTKIVTIPLPVIEPQICIVTKHSMNDRLRFTFGAGGYVSENVHPYDVVYFDDKGNIATTLRWRRRPNFGVMANVGVELNKRVFIRADIRRILTSIFTLENTDPNTPKFSFYAAYYKFGLSAGYLFRTGKKAPKPELKS